MQAKLAAKEFLEGRKDIVILDSFFGMKEAYLSVISVTLLLLFLLARLAFGCIAFGGGSCRRRRLF